MFMRSTSIIWYNTPKQVFIIFIKFHRLQNEVKSKVHFGEIWFQNVKHDEMLLTRYMLVNPNARTSHASTPLRSMGMFRVYSFTWNIIVIFHPSFNKNTRCWRSSTFFSSLTFLFNRCRLGRSWMSLSSVLFVFYTTLTLTLLSHVRGTHISFPAKRRRWYQLYAEFGR